MYISNDQKLQVTKRGHRFNQSIFFDNFRKPHLTKPYLRNQEKHSSTMYTEKSIMKRKVDQMEIDQDFRSRDMAFTRRTCHTYALVKLLRFPVSFFFNHGTDVETQQDSIDQILFVMVPFHTRQFQLAFNYYSCMQNGNP